jgi:hypothetical protein
LKNKEGKEIKEKKRKKTYPGIFWQQKYMSFEIMDLDWGGLYRDCSLHLEAVGERLSVHDESGDVMVYHANCIEALSTLGLI